MERRRCNEENKELGWDEKRKKDRRRIRASAVLLQGVGDEGRSGVEKKELVPAHISCFNMFSGARQKVGVKQSYGQRYCSIVLKCNYVSSGGLLCTLAIDWCLYFASV